MAKSGWLGCLVIVMVNCGFLIIAVVVWALLSPRHSEDRHEASGNVASNREEVRTDTQTATLTESTLLVAGRLHFKPDGTFKIVHVTDTHYEIGPNAASCQGRPWYESKYQPCSASNTTEFLARVLRDERPDLVVFTGDIVTGRTIPATKGMDELYGVATAAGVPWAATLGNHDDDDGLSRKEVMEYIAGMPGGLSQVNPLVSSAGDRYGPRTAYGNFVLEIYNDSSTAAPSFRTYHLDSDSYLHSVNDGQIAWFNRTAAALAAVAPAPALAFFHHPLEQYNSALRHRSPISGEIHDAVHFRHPEWPRHGSGLFHELREGRVVATFCGHDHNNDFCTTHAGVQLCYSGAAGYQAYQRVGRSRRVRVAALRQWGAELRSWKVVDNPGVGVLDDETLWPPTPEDHRRPLNPYERGLVLH